MRVQHPLCHIQPRTDERRTYRYRHRTYRHPVAGVASVVEVVFLILFFFPPSLQASLAIVVLDCRSCLVAVALSLLCGCAVVTILYTPPLKQFVLALTPHVEAFSSRQPCFRLLRAVLAMSRVVIDSGVFEKRAHA